MNRAVLKSFLRSIADPATPDADVLARYRDGRDAGAFAELVARYGRLVWSVCKHRSRTEADAEDAFQATFLVFSQRAASIRNGTALGAWLYGVASRVCSKAHRAAGRRAKRERANGVREATNDVAASVWDRALAAVHEEVETLPEHLRVPFVMCALEGRSPGDAATALGWKLGTLSGRLTRAKDALIARLDARGLSAGAVAAATVGVNVTNAPATVVARALAYASRDSVVPQTILHLTQGVIEMNVIRVKILAAAVLVACELGGGVGSQWVATAQDPLPSRPGLFHDPNQTEEYGKYLSKLKSVSEAAKSETDIPPPLKTKSKWEYQFLTRPVGYAPTTEKFQSTIMAVEADGGWEYVGLINTKEGPDRETLPTLVFRRPVRAEASAEPKVERVYGSVEDLAKARQFMDYKGRYQDTVRTVDEKDKKIADLEAELARLKATAPKDEGRLTLAQKDLPLGVTELRDILTRVAAKIGMKSLQVAADPSGGGSLHLVGTKDQVEWARRTIETLGGKADPVRR